MPTDVLDQLSPDIHTKLSSFFSSRDAFGQLVGPFVVFPLRSSNTTRFCLLGQNAALDLILGGEPTRISPAETRVILQVLAGQPLREAAQHDDLSYETKRSQLSSALGKLGFARQADIAQAFLAGLLVKLSQKDQLSDPAAFLRGYCARFLPDRDVRCHSLIDPCRNEHQVLDIGPLDGRKILGVHPHVLPRLDRSDFETLNRHGLRIIWPIRPGAFTVTDPDLTPQQHRAVAQNGLRAVHAAMFDGPAPVAATVDGTNYAIQLLSDHPACVSHMIFIGFAGAPTGQNVLGGILRRGAIRLSAKAPGLLRKAFEHYAQTMQDPAKLQKAVEKMYLNSPVDHAVITSEFQGPDRGADFQTRVLGSVGTIRQDMMYQAEDLTHLLRSANTPLYFIHGELDDVQPIKNVDAYIQKLGKGKLIRLPDCGQLIYGPHFEKSAAAVAKILSA